MEERVFPLTLAHLSPQEEGTANSEEQHGQEGGYEEGEGEPPSAALAAVAVGEGEEEEAAPGWVDMPRRAPARRTLRYVQD